MLTNIEIEDARKRAAVILTRAGIVLTSDERMQLEVTDVGLGDLEACGLQVVVYDPRKHVALVSSRRKGRRNIRVL